MLRWAEAFNHYGSSTANMLKGAWAAFNGIDGTPVLSTDQARSGTRSLKIGGTASYTTLNSQCNARRVLGVASTTVGFDTGIYMGSLPTRANMYGWCFEDVLGNILLTFHIGTDGAILGRIGGVNAPVVFATDPILTAGGWWFIETKMTFDDTVGRVEIKIENSTRCVATNLNISSVPATVVRVGCIKPSDDGGTQLPLYFADMRCWDDTGAEFNDFMGPKRITTSFVAADTAQADWTLHGAATGTDCINQANPDLDATYIAGETVGAKSDFELPTLPAEIENVTAVYVPALARLSDVGSGSLSVSLISEGEIDQGPDLPLISSYLYTGTTFYTDPNTGEPWTKAALEAALIRVEKTA